MPQELLNSIFEMDEFRFSNLGLSLEDLLSHNLICRNELVICTLDHIKFLSEITLLSLSCQPAGELLHIHLSSLLFEFSLDGSISSLHHQHKEEELSE